MSANRTQYVIGIDVGTTSARAGVFTADGELKGAASHPIRLWRDGADIAEHSSDDIWQACATALRAALAEAAIAPDSVMGLGFDATCSMVVLDNDFRPLSVSATGDPARNVIVWMDHRAAEEAHEINAKADPVLAYVGGAVSPEMQTPKLLWLRRHMPATYEQAGHFLDLADYLTWRATGSLERSACTVACKWTWLAHEGRWSGDFFRRIGLGDHPDSAYARIGARIAAPGAPLGAGLLPQAARDLGLPEGTPVAAGLIDAHAGGLATIGGAGADPMRRIAFILGTSACTMAVSPEPRFVPGIWGPYLGAMVPGLWLAEGGQSASGAAIDHLLRLHPAHNAAYAEAKAKGMSVPALLEAEILHDIGADEAARLAGGVHVLPDFLGNRSPFADPDARAMILGLDLDDTRAGLRRLFVAGLCGLGCGLAQITAALTASGFALDAIVASGGAARSLLFRRIVADATGLAIILPETPEPVLLGAAMLGAVAGGVHPDLRAAMHAMARDGAVLHPATGAMADFHAARRAVFADMQALDRRARGLVSG